MPHILENGQLLPYTPGYATDPELNKLICLFVKILALPQFISMGPYNETAFYFFAVD